MMERVLQRQDASSGLHLHLLYCCSCFHEHTQKKDEKEITHNRFDPCGGWGEENISNGSLLLLRS